MTRNPNGDTAFTPRELRGWLLILPILQLIFTAGAAWAGVRVGLEKKIDRQEFETHVHQTELLLQRMQITDSLVAATAAADRERIREIMCDGLNLKKGCR